MSGGARFNEELQNFFNTFSSGEGKKDRQYVCETKSCSNPGKEKHLFRATVLGGVPCPNGISLRRPIVI